MTTTNPLLDFSDLPRFDLVRPEHVKPAIESLLTAGRELVVRLTADTTPPTWRDFAGALADGLEPFGRAWGVVGHLHSVNDVPAWREAYNEMLPEVSRFYAELGQNLKLFDKYKALRAGADYPKLSVEQRRVVDNEIRDFRLSGAELPEDQKPRFQAIMEEISQLSAKFSENLLDATNAFAESVTDEASLAGLPDDVKAAAATAAASAGVDGWKFTLHAPSYGPVMQYADNRELRARMYRAYATRAAEFHDGTSKPEWDNTPVIQRMLELRQEDAAQKVERQMRKSEAALVLESHVGQYFDAIVTGVGTDGIWVRVFTPPAEGKLVQGNDGLRVGDKVRVTLIATNVEHGFIDFALQERTRRG